MRMQTIQELLAFVDGPSRYLGNEVNTVRKDPAAVDLKMALAFPDLYEIGTSHFGIQILYDLLNRDSRIAAERVFAPAEDMAGYLVDHGIPLSSLESGTALKDFDIVGFSLLYELNYTNVLAMLELGGIPLLSRDRGAGDPLVVAGGPCTCNPEPMADFFDAMVFGDGENVVVQLAERWFEWRKSGGSRDDLLVAWSGIDGVYIPGFFDVRYDGDGFQHLKPRYGTHQTVQRAIVSDLDAAPFPENPVLPYGRPVHDRLRIELSRGCTRGCRFCQAGMIYRPVRERSPERVLDLCETALKTTGYEDVSLLSLSTGDYTCLVPLLEQMMSRYACDHVAVSLPSVRAEALSPALMNLIKKVRKTGFTIAPEAGSQRLRDVINKNISEAQIEDAVSGAFGLGWNLIKLYFMIGLPTETQADLDDLVALVEGLRKIKGPDGRYGKINVSVATFIPKPHTPFQWAQQADLNASQEKIAWLQEQLRRPGVQFKWQNPEMSYLEGLMARGDRRMAGVIQAAYEKGCRFDGWSDRFRFNLWREAIDGSGLVPDFFMTRPRQTDEPLPWAHMDSGVTGEYLAAEWDGALNRQSTSDCRHGVCNQCGVCDFDAIEPVIFEHLEKTEKHPSQSNTGDAARKLEIAFTKIGPARFFGHLEMVNSFTRAMKRADIPVNFTEGYHPKPKIAFQDALPVGLESLCETLVVDVSGAIEPAEVARRLNAQLPEGLRVTGSNWAGPKSKGVQEWRSTYRVKLVDGRLDPERLKAFDAAEHWTVERRGKKGRTRKVDLKQMVRSIRWVGNQTLEIAVESRNGVNLRPAVVLTEVFGVSDDALRRAEMVRLGKGPVTPPVEA